MTPQEQIDDILDNFDFDKVHKVMVFLNWKYGGSVPTVSELKENARGLLKEAVKLDLHWYSSGGFHVKHEVFEKNSYISLEFVIAEWDNEE